MHDITTPILEEQPLTPPPSSSHFVYQAIYTAILEKRLAPATKLSKETLGRIFRVSTGTVQRALTRLADEGAVDLTPNQVATIARPSERLARQVLEARLLVEAEIMRLAGPRLTAADLDALRAVVACQRRRLAAGDHAGLIEQACQFHLRLAERAGNPLLLDFLRNLLPRAALGFALSKSRVYSDAACQEQTAMLDALAAGELVRASRLMTAHLEGLFARLRFTPPPTEDLRAALQGRFGTLCTA